MVPVIRLLLINSLVLISTSGCWYAPWEDVEYVLIESDDTAIGKDRKLSQSVSILPTFRKCNVHAKQGNSEFKICLSVFGKKGQHESVRIKRVTALTAEGRVLHEYTSSDEGRVLPFQQDTERDSNVWAFTDFEGKLKIQSQQYGRVIVKVSIDVLFSSDWSNYDQEFVFEERLNSGRFQWIVQ